MFIYLSNYPVNLSIFIDIFMNSLFSNAAMRFAIIHARAQYPETANAGSIPTDEGGIVPVSVLTDEV